MKKMIQILLAFCLTITGNAQSKKIFFEEQFAASDFPKKVRLRLYEYYFEGNEILDTTIFLSRPRFSIQYPIRRKTGYLKIEYPASHNRWPQRIYYIQPGDSVTIARNQTASQYFGRGSDLFDIIDSVQAISLAHAYAGIKGSLTVDKLIRQRQLLDEVLQKKNGIVLHAEKNIGKLMTETLLLDNFCACWQYNFEYLAFRWSQALKDSTVRKEYLQFFKKCLQETKLAAISKTLSLMYPSFVLARSKAEVEILVSSRRFNDVLRNMMQQSVTPNQQQLYLYALTQLPYFNRVDSSSELIRKAKVILKDPPYSLIFERTIAKQLKGSSALDFSFVDTRSKRVHLHEFLGKTILLDFWFTGCTGCKQVAPYLKRLEDSLTSRKDLVFISVSVDQDKERWLNSVATQSYGSQNAINLYTGGHGGDNTFLKTYNIKAFPTLMIIDSKGNLYEGNAIRPYTEQNLNDLTLQLLSATTK